MRGRAARIVSLVLAGAAACAVRPFDGTNKRCPCIDGYVCDTATDTCVPTSAQLAPSPVDASADAPSDAPIAPSPPRILVQNLRAVWSTGNSVYWAWDVAGDPNDFGSYEIVTGPGADAVGARTPGVRVFRPADNAELGSFRGIDRSLDGDPVEPFTVTDDHPPGAEVFAQVTGIDKSGSSSLTPVASAKTTQPTVDRLVFNEDDLPGTSMPASFVRSTDRPYRGRYCYAYTVACPNGAATCFVQLQRSAIAADATGMPAAAFANAFLEFAVAGGAAVPTFYSEIMLFVGPPTCNNFNGGMACRWKYRGWTFRGEDTWRLIQIPLRLLKRDSGKPLSYDELKSQNFKLHAIGLSGTWANGASVRIDEIHVRW